MKTIKKIIVLVICFLLPVRMVFWILNLLGHNIHSKAKIGFSFIWLDESMTLKEMSSIGHFNIIKIKAVRIEPLGYIGRFNKLVGPFEIILAEKAAIGDGNKCNRSPLGVSYGNSVLRLGTLSKITANHRVDCTRSITIGDYSTIAGHDTQLWTHAYYHDKTGAGRFRLDGGIEIGNNVYIGSRCILNGGVAIVDNVVVGANSCVSKSLLNPGTYVNQPLRYFEFVEHQDLRSKFKKIEGFSIEEEVYERK